MIDRHTLKIETVEPKLGEPLISGNDAATVANVKLSVLTSAIHDGELPSYRQVETRTLVYMSEVFAALNKAEQWGTL